MISARDVDFEFDTNWNPFVSSDLLSLRHPRYENKSPYTKVNKNQNFIEVPLT